MPRLSALAASVAFFLCVALGTFVVTHLFPGEAAGSLRAQATVRISGAIAGEVLCAALVMLYLRTRRRSLEELGFGRPAPPAGWAAALVLTALFIALMLTGPLRDKAPLTEVSLFHAYNSLLAGFGAGFCEEIVFRGFVMTELERAGHGRLTQVLASGILFGLGHFRFGGLGGGFDWTIALASVAPTFVMGTLYAAIYLLSRRSLPPVIASHAIIDVIIEPWLVLAALSGALR